MKWFSLSAIAKEIGKIRWPRKEDLFNCGLSSISKRNSTLINNPLIDFNDDYMNDFKINVFEIFKLYMPEDANDITKRVKVI